MLAQFRVGGATLPHAYFASGNIIAVVRAKSVYLIARSCAKVPLPTNYWGMIVNWYILYYTVACSLEPMGETETR